MTPTGETGNATLDERRGDPAMGGVPSRGPGRDGIRRGLQPAATEKEAAAPLSVIHPCFEQLAPSWRDHGEYRVREYFAEYEIPGPYASSFHRSLSAYLNELVRLGCQLREIAEPALDPATAAAAGPSAEAYAHLPNFLVVAARRS